MRLLVTGGAGFIGSHYVRSVLAGAYGGPRVTSVVVLDKLTYAGNEANLAAVAGDDRLSLVRGDVTDASLVDDLTAQVEIVVHLAAESHVDRSIERGQVFAATNMVGTQTLLDAAVRHGLPRFVQVSTDEVYGPVPVGFATEEARLAPSSAYAASKAGADLLVLAAYRTHGLGVSITRGTNTYGPFQHREKVVPRFITRLLDGDRLPLFGDGRQQRTWLHVDDHARALHAVVLAGRPGVVYNVAGGTPLSNLELTRRILAETGADASRIDHVADRPGHDVRYAVDGSRIRDELGFTPHRGFDDGLTQTVRWYREHREWWRDQPS